MADEVLVAASGLNRYYGNQQALHDVDITLRRGEVLGFLGLNGAGKTTTMKILAGALRPHEGTVESCGASLATQPLQAKKSIGYLPEIPPLYDEVQVNDYLIWCARLRGMPRGAIRPAVDQACAQCGLPDVDPRLIGHLSKGYQQRIGIAQAIVHSPAVLILDEPSSGLDPRQIRAVRDLIGTLARERAIIVSTHILPEVQILTIRIMILHDGRVVHDAPVGASNDRLRVRFHSELSGTVLGSISGVRHAHSTGGGGWVLEVDNCEDVAQAVADRAVAEDWGLIELQPNYDALEHLFMRLTGGEPIAEDDA